jgi:hypothetical protein
MSKWVRHVEYMEEVKNAYNVFFWRIEEKTPLGETRCR